MLDLLDSLPRMLPWKLQDTKSPQVEVFQCFSLCVYVFMHATFSASMCGVCVIPSPLISLSSFSPTLAKMHTEKGKHDYEDTILRKRIDQIIIKKLKVAEECL